ncbi:NAD(P)-dependent oxidoreductase [Candidatus Curtissbacteria bacterium]|nr:NAD(P)-dependent oxidoreductase [Candidatus Curtissbacteria bacterium]
MKKTKIIVSGAAGFVGRNMIPFLLGAGYKPIALVKNETEQKSIEKFGVATIVSDLSKAGSWQQQIQCDVLIHLASEISSKNEINFKKNNVVATKNKTLIQKQKKNKKI